jgi:hypothetical protein
MMLVRHCRLPLCLMHCRDAMRTCYPGCFAPDDEVCYHLSISLPLTVILNKHICRIGKSVNVNMMINTPPVLLLFFR